MTTLIHRRRRFAFCSAVLLLGGCAGGSGNPGASPIASFAGLPLPAAIALRQQPDTSKSWISPAASKTKVLLYIADQYTDDVYIDQYKSAAPVGKITGLKLPFGLCVDAVGDIYVTDYYGESVTKYAHGSIKAGTTLDTGGPAIGCSVSPDGDLAVSNYGLFSHAGSVVVFTKASGKPTSYTNAELWYPWSPGYDNRGNLYVEAANNGQHTSVFELPTGGTSLRSVTFAQPIEQAAGVMWDGKYITLTDQGYPGFTTEIYQTVELPSGDLSLVAATNLRGSVSCSEAGIAQPFIVGRLNTPINSIQGNVVVGGNQDCGDDTFGYWNYPTGGVPFKELTLRTGFKGSRNVAPSKTTTEYSGQAVSIKE